jgi:CRISPR-associated protein Cas1
LSWRIIAIQNQAQLKLKNRQLQIDQEETCVTIPVEDICALILESSQITVSTALLSFTQDQNIVVITCDQKHIPNGIMLPFHQHSRQTEVAYLQVDWSLPFQNRCWQKLIQQKIENQAKCLEVFNHPHWMRLYVMAKRVDSGDRKNVEAHAAKLYWQYLFSSSFRRKQDNLITAALNYGYAIGRALLCRAIVSYGLLPCFGVHHKSTLNAFNLADDLLEPFRPMIDCHVKKILENFEETSELTKEIRQELMKIGMIECSIDGEVHIFHNVAELCCRSLVTATREKSVQLFKVPVFYHE